VAVDIQVNGIVCSVQSANAIQIIGHHAGSRVIAVVIFWQSRTGLKLSAQRLRRRSYPGMRQQNPINPESTPSGYDNKNGIAQGMPVEIGEREFIGNAALLVEQRQVALLFRFKIVQGYSAKSETMI
jgi:hypothetical protein